MSSLKQGSIKYHFLSLWYDSTWDWTPVSRPLVNTLLIRQSYMIVISRISLVGKDIKFISPPKIHSE